MTAQSKADKWNRIYAVDEHGQFRAAKVLQDHLHLLPFTGKALDVACGLGNNALLLAQHGLQTYAWDISQIAVDKLLTCTENLNISLQVEARDITALPPAAESFDIIVVSHFLERTLIPHLIAALRKGGLIYYQTFIKDKVGAKGPQNPEYRLNRNELLDLFRSLQIVFYREEALLGDLNQGFRNEAMLIAQKEESHG
jgi:SAM-dependent methyltransferase